MKLFLPLILATCFSFSAAADPVVKVIYFTADWCANCRAFEPILEDALDTFPDGDIERVDIDLTRSTQRFSDEERRATWRGAFDTAMAHDVAYLVDWFGNRTGIAVVVAADNGEPINCLQRPLDANQVTGRLREAMIFSRRRAPGTRMPDGPECPAPTR
ncbi:MAG: thioredoxin family protein [Pseudomonadota bacterium]